VPRRDDDPERSHDPEAEGIPDLDGPLPGKVITGDAQEGMSPPRDVPVAALEYGTTAYEEEVGESLDLKLAREEPDVTEDDVFDDDAAEDTVGRLIDEGDDLSDGAVADDEKDAVAGNEDADPATLSAEEAAVHEIREE
jgi:hypothetical protein